MSEAHIFHLSVPSFLGHKLPNSRDVLTVSFINLLHFPLSHLSLSPSLSSWSQVFALFLQGETNNFSALLCDPAHTTLSPCSRSLWKKEPSLRPGPPGAVTSPALLRQTFLLQDLCPAVVCVWDISRSGNTLIFHQAQSHENGLLCLSPMDKI